MPERTNNDALLDIWCDVKRLVEGISCGIKWATDEVHQAMDRHPSEHDVLYHSFPLLQATHRIMATEFVYRSHCREILERLVCGADTRPATAAEVCCICCEISLRAPLRSEVAGLYLRMWGTAFPGQPMFNESSQHHEALEGAAIDRLEAAVRLKLTVKNRALTDVACAGVHDGAVVQCKLSGAWRPARPPTCT